MSKASIEKVTDAIQLVTNNELLESFDEALQTCDAIALLIVCASHNTHLLLHSPKIFSMYSHSRKWINPEVQEQNQRLSERIRLNTARRKFCPRSPFFHANFDIVAHQLEWEADLQRAQANKIGLRIHEAATRKRLDLPPPAPIKPAFNGHEFKDNFGPVTCWRTVFTPAYNNPDRPLDPYDPYDKEPGQWPSKAEMKYEGDERVSTDKLHGRCLAAPRVEGNETVNWMHRSIVPQYPLDNLHYPPPNEVEIWVRSHHIPELEITDKEGRALLGRDLMEALNWG